MTTATFFPVSAHDSFRDAIAAAPTDTLVRLVYADYLAETGDSLGEEWQRATASRLEREAHEAKIRAATAKRTSALHALAVALGQRYHAGVEDLYLSKRATVVYGPGGQEDLDWDAYGKSGKNYRPNGRGIPAKWRNAGARLDSETSPKCIILQTHRGTEKVRLPLPSAPRGRKVATAGGRTGQDVGKALLRGDLWGWERTLCGLRIVTRYGWTPRKGKSIGHYHVSGYAVQLTVPEAAREQGRSAWGIFSTTDATYWEHGCTVAECRAEYRRKCGLVVAALTAAAGSAKIARAAARIAARWPNLVCTYEDARNCGYCVAGIGGFAGRFGLTGRTEATVAELRATGAGEVEKVIGAAALRTAKALFARKGT